MAQPTLKGRYTLKPAFHDSSSRLFKYEQWLTRKRFLTSKLYKSANADIVVGSFRHTA